MSPETLDLLTLIVALLALLASAASVAVSVMTYLYTGARVKVTSGSGLISPGFDTALITIVARNVGRSSVSVTNYGLEIVDGERGAIFGPMNPLAISPDVPTTLLGGHEKTWYLEEAAMVDALAHNGRHGAIEVAPFVILGTGKTVHADKRTIAV